MIFRLLETALSMAVVYFLLCTFVSGVNEWIASRRGTRGTFLKRGIRHLLPDQPIFRRVMQHPLVGALYRDDVAKGRPPSYLDPGSFARALADVVVARGRLAGVADARTGDAASLKASLEAISLDHPVVAQALRPIVDVAGADYDAMIKGIEAWYSSSMDRVSGWYQAYARKRLFVLGVLVAALGNVDSVQLVRSFWNSPGLRSAAEEISDRIQAEGDLVPAPAASDPETSAVARDLLRLQSEGLPIGFDCLVAQSGEAAIVRRCGSAAWSLLREEGLLKLLGWLLTGLAVSLGAPFWFQALSRAAPMRASGPKP